MISCSLTKASGTMPARDAYSSRTFKARLELVLRTHAEDEVRILSSHYGLIGLKHPVVYYDEWIHNWPKAKRVAWQERVLNEISADVVTIHAGKSYYHPVLESRLLLLGRKVIVPTRGMSNLQTYSWLAKELLK